MRLPTFALAAALAAALTPAGCVMHSEIPTSAERFRIEPGAVSHLQPGAVAVLNGYGAESKVRFNPAPNMVWVYDQKELTGTAVAMLRRALDERGARADAQAQKRITLLVFNLRVGATSPVGARALLRLRAQFEGGAVIDIDAEGPATERDHAADAAVLVALNQLVADARFTQYINGP